MQKAYQTIKNHKDINIKHVLTIICEVNAYMLKVLDDEKEIAIAQKAFMNKLNVFAEKSGTINVGYQGGSSKVKAFYSSKLGIWWVFDDSVNRYWNAFGTEEIRWNTGYSHSIICEINPPFKGINRRISGAFAKDPNGKLYLFHRGRIGGGKPGIGKTAFMKGFGKDVWEELEDGNKFSKLALIASFDNPKFAQQVAYFVHTVELIKKYKSHNLILAPIFREDFSGTKEISSTSSKAQFESDHRLIVNNLAKKLIIKGHLFEVA